MIVEIYFRKFVYVVCIDDLSLVSSNGETSDESDEISDDQITKICEDY